MNNENSSIRFNPYDKCRVRLTYIGATILNDCLEGYRNEVEEAISNYYMNDDDGIMYDFHKKDFVEALYYAKEQAPQRYLTYQRGDIYEDEFVFIMNVLSKSLAYNKRTFDEIYCYVGDGDIDECWIEIYPMKREIK